jgi:hypothetical protein
MGNKIVYNTIVDIISSRNAFGTVQFFVLG